MIHIRAVTPADVTPGLVEALAAKPGVSSLVILHGVAKSPDGDAVQFDVIRAEANAVLHELRNFAVDRRGSISIENIDTAISDRAARAEGREPEAANFAPIWEEAEAKIRAGGHYPRSWFALLVIAGLIAAVGILTNSEILIVGAMVVGPEYAAIISVALAINKRERSPLRRGLMVLAVGFLIAIAFAFAFGLVIRILDLEPMQYSAGTRPVSDLIDAPNVYSVIVAVLAGIVGVVSLTEARTAALTGVFISITTIPAAADIGVSSAFELWSEAWGSLIQLLLNLVILIVVGAVGLRVQRRLWRGVGESFGTA